MYIILYINYKTIQSSVCSRFYQATPGVKSELNRYAQMNQSPTAESAGQSTPARIPASLRPKPPGRKDGTNSLYIAVLNPKSGRSFAPRYLEPANHPHQVSPQVSTEERSCQGPEGPSRPQTVEQFQLEICLSVPMTVCAFVRSINY